jgi:hypothetical protein
MSSDAETFPCKKPKLKENTTGPQQTQRSSNQFMQEQEVNQAQINLKCTIKIEQIPVIDLNENIDSKNKKDITKVSVTTQPCNEQSEHKSRKTQDKLQSTEEYIEHILEIKNENNLIEDTYTKVIKLISTTADKISNTDKLEDKNLNNAQTKRGNELECQICSETFGTKSELKIHVSAVHRKKKAFQCEICSWGFVTPSRLKSHTDQVHNKIKPFKCEICSKGFGSGANLKTHNDTVHKKIKSYKREICSKALSNKSKLNKHIEKIHNNLKLKPSTFTC